MACKINNNWEHITSLVRLSWKRLKSTFRIICLLCRRIVLRSCHLVLWKMKDSFHIEFQCNKNTEYYMIRDLLVLSFSRAFQFRRAFCEIPYGLNFSALRLFSLAQPLLSLLNSIISLNFCEDPMERLETSSPPLLPPQMIERKHPYAIITKPWKKHQ